MDLSARLEDQPGDEQLLAQLKGETGVGHLSAWLESQPGGEQLLAAARAAKASEEAALVGGAVRDLLLGRAPRELDVVVAGDAAVFAAGLASRLGASVATHGRFGTASVEWERGRIDVAAARRERYPAPGALPEVEPATLEEDLCRRDFTVNAIAVMLDGERPGEVRPVPGALEDLRAGRLRILHDASFADDPTRLLRMARYAARLGFEIEPHTAALAAAAVGEHALDTVSGARIGAELKLALGEPDALATLAKMDELGLLAAIHPRIRFDRSTIQSALALLPGDGRPDLLMMAALTLALALRVGDDPRAEIAALLDRLELAASDRDRVAAAAVAAPRLADELPAAERPSRLRAAVAGAPPEAVALAGAIGEAAAGPARRWLTELRGVRLTITGEDLLAAGVPEGPEVGRRLEVALRMKLDGELLDGRDAELNAALNAALETRL
jgi:tRNA nucleotidyltransferase (CCA-adding enzyme)